MPTLMQFRFVVYTDLNSTARPGWYIDEYLVTNVGNSTGFWHHGCYTLTATTCYYSNNAEAALEGSIDLSSTNAGSKIQTRLEFDLEGSSYDNFCVELSTNNELLGLTFHPHLVQARVHVVLGVLFPVAVTPCQAAQRFTMNRVALSYWISLFQVL